MVANLLDEAILSLELFGFLSVEAVCSDVFERRQIQLANKSVDSGRVDLVCDSRDQFSFGVALVGVGHPFLLSHSEEEFSIHLLEDANGGHL